MCVFVLVNWSLYGCMPFSAAIMVGRSVSVFVAFVNLLPYGCEPCQQLERVEDPYLWVFAVVNLSLYGLDAVSAAIRVGRSLSVCLAFVSWSFSGFGAVQVWKRMNPFRRDMTLLWNMVGKCEVSVIRVFVARPCCLLLSGFFSIVCILSRSRTVRGPVVCFAHECSQLSRWLL